MTQAQQVLQAPRMAMVSLLLVAALAVGIVSGLALAGTSLFDGIGSDEGPRHLRPEVQRSGVEWELQRDQQRMFGATIPPGWFERSGE
jgi:hypothetical protein